MTANIVVVGSSNTDMIIKLDRIPKPGETRLGGEFLTAAGGKGANQAVAAARAGGAVTLVARVGKDMFGQQAVDGLAADGVNVDFVRRDRKPSGAALIFVADNGENSIAVASGANAELSPGDVRRARSAIAAADVLLVQLETPLPTVEASVELAAARGVRVILNPAPAQRLPERLLARVGVLTPNESEAELLTGVAVHDIASCQRAADVLLAKGVGMVIITLGSRGAFIASPELSELAPGFDVTPVDTTAAGDVFNGALAVALAEGRSTVEAVRFANAAGALSVMQMGAQPSAPRRRAIEGLIKAGGSASVAAASARGSAARSRRKPTSARGTKKG